jgi:hypothetical protein
MTNYLDYCGIITTRISSVSEFYRSPQMPYEFSTLSPEDMAQEAARVKKQLERELYGAILLLGEDPAGYDTAAHTVPDDETSANYPVKLDIARILSNIAFVNSI